MSKDILVNKGDTLTVIRDISKLVTNLSNGSMATWIPEDETLLVTKTIIKDGTYEASREASKPYGYSQVTVTGVGNKIMGDLGEKSITKNGIYIAKQDKDGPFYGYSKLYVNVPGGDDGSGGGSSSPTITGKDGDGDDAIVGTDEDGKIVTSKLPTRISINVYPNNLVYEDGQTIDFTGLRVKAFLPDGTEWGIVDDNELIKPVTVAEYKDTEVISDLEGIEEYMPLNVAKHGILNGMWRGNPASHYQYMTGEGVHTIFDLEGVGYIFRIGASKNPDDKLMIRFSPGIDSGSGADISLGQSRIINDKTVYYGYSNAYWTGSDTYVIWTTPTMKVAHNGWDIGKIAWAMVYGDIESEGTDGSVIPLQWKRPGDKKILETSFSISIHPSS